MVLLNSSLEVILSSQNQAQLSLQPLKDFALSSFPKRPTDYKFHGTHGHSTNKCHELMNQIETFDQKGKAKKVWIDQGKEIVWTIPRDIGGMIEDKKEG